MWFTGTAEFEIRISNFTTIAPYMAKLIVSALPTPAQPSSFTCNTSMVYDTPAVITMLDVPLATTEALTLEVDILDPSVIPFVVYAQVYALETLSGYPSVYHWANITTSPFSWSLPAIAMPTGSSSSRNLSSLVVALRMESDFVGLVPISVRLSTTAPFNNSASASWLRRATLRWHYNQAPVVETSPVWPLLTLENEDISVAWLPMLLQPKLKGGYMTSEYNLTGISLWFFVNSTIASAELNSSLGPSAAEPTIAGNVKKLFWAFNVSNTEISAADSFDIAVLHFRHGVTTITANFSFQSGDESVRPRVLTQPMRLEVQAVAQVPSIEFVRHPVSVSVGEVASIAIQISSPVLDGTDSLNMVLWADTPLVRVADNEGFISPMTNATVMQYGVTYKTSFVHSIQSWALQLKASSVTPGPVGFLLEIRATVATNASSVASTFFRFAIEVEPDVTPILMSGHVHVVDVFGGDVWTLNPSQLTQAVQSHLPSPFDMALIRTVGYSYTLATAAVDWVNSTDKGWYRPLSPYLIYEPKHADVPSLSVVVSNASAIVVLDLELVFTFFNFSQPVLAPLRVALRIAPVPPMELRVVGFTTVNVTDYDEPKVLNVTLACPSAVLYLSPPNFEYLVNGVLVPAAAIHSPATMFELTILPPLHANFSGFVDVQVFARCSSGAAMSVSREVEWLANPEPFVFPTTTSNMSTNENTWLEVTAGSVLNTTNRTVNDVRYTAVSLSYAPPVDRSIAQIQLLSSNSTRLDAAVLRVLPAAHFSGITTVTIVVQYVGEVIDVHGHVTLLQNRTAKHRLLVLVHPMAVAPLLALDVDTLIDFGNYSRATLNVTVGGDLSQTTRVDMSCTGNMAVYAQQQLLSVFDTTPIATLNTNTTLHWVFAPTKPDAGPTACMLTTTTKSVDLGLGTNPTQMVATQSVNWTVEWLPETPHQVLQTAPFSFAVPVGGNVTLVLPELIPAWLHATTCYLQWRASEVAVISTDSGMVTETWASVSPLPFAQAAVACANVSRLNVQMFPKYNGDTAIGISAKIGYAYLPIALTIIATPPPALPRLALASDALVVPYETPAILVVQAPSRPGILGAYEIRSSPPIVQTVILGGAPFTADAAGVIALGSWPSLESTLTIMPPLGFAGTVTLTLTIFIQTGNSIASASKLVNITWMRAAAPALNVPISQVTVLATQLIALPVQVALQSQDVAVGAVALTMTASSPLQDVSPSERASSGVYTILLPATTVVATPLRYYAGNITLAFRARATAFASQADSTAEVNVTVVPVVSTPNVSLLVPVMVQNVPGILAIQIAPISTIGYSETSRTTLVLSGVGVGAVFDTVANSTVSCTTVGLNAVACPLSAAFSTARNASLLLTPLPSFAGAVNVSVVTVNSIMPSPLSCMYTAWNASALRDCCSSNTTQCASTVVFARLVVAGITATPRVIATPTMLLSSAQSISAVQITALDVLDPYDLHTLSAAVVCPANMLQTLVLSQRYARTKLSKAFNVSGTEVFPLTWTPGALPIGLEFIWTQNLSAATQFKCTLMVTAQQKQLANSSSETTNTTFSVALNSTPSVIALPQAYIEVEEGSPVVVATAVASVNYTLVLEWPSSLVQRVNFINASVVTTTTTGNRTFVTALGAAIAGSFNLTTVMTSGDTTLLLYAYPSTTMVPVFSAMSAYRVMVRLNPIPFMPTTSVSPSVLFVDTSVPEPSPKLQVATTKIDVDNVVTISVGVPVGFVAAVAFNGHIGPLVEANTTTAIYVVDVPSAVAVTEVSLLVASSWSGQFLATVDVASMQPTTGAVVSRRFVVSIVAFEAILAPSALMAPGYVEGPSTAFLPIQVTSNVSNLMIWGIEQKGLASVVANGLVIPATTMANTSFPVFRIPQPIVSLFVQSLPGFTGFYSVALVGTDDFKAVRVVPVRIFAQPVALPPQLVNVSTSIVNSTTVAMAIVSALPAPTNGLDILTLSLTLPIAVPVVGCFVPSSPPLSSHVGQAMQMFEMPAATTSVQIVLSASYVGSFQIAVVLTDKSGLVSTSSVQATVPIVIAPTTAAPAASWTYTLSSQPNKTTPLPPNVAVNGSESWLALVPVVPSTDTSMLEIIVNAGGHLLGSTDSSQFLANYSLVAPPQMMLSPYNYGPIAAFVSATTTSVAQTTGVVRKTTTQSARVRNADLRVAPVAQLPAISLQLPPPIPGFGPWAVYEADAIAFTVQVTVPFSVPTQSVQCRLTVNPSQVASVVLNGTVAPISKGGTVFFPVESPANPMLPTNVSIVVVPGTFGRLPMLFSAVNTESLNNDTKLVTTEWNVTIVPIGHVPALFVVPNAPMVLESEPLRLNLTAIPVSTTESITLTVASSPQGAVLSLLQGNVAVSNVTSGRLVTVQLAQYWFGSLQLNVTALAQESVSSPRAMASAVQSINVTVLPVAYPPLLIAANAVYGVMGAWINVPITASSLAVNRSSGVDVWSMSLVTKASTLAVWANQSLLSANLSQSSFNFDVFSVPVASAISVQPKTAYGGVYVVTIRSTDTVAVSKTAATSTQSTTMYIAGVQVTPNTTVVPQGTGVVFAINVNSPPQAPVNLTLVCNDTSRLVIPAPLIATTNTTYKWLLSSTRDYMDNGNNSVMCAINMATADPYYQQITLPNTSLLLLNADKSSFTLSGTLVNNKVQLTVAEGGFTDTYSVALTSKPFAPVQLTLTTNVSSLRPVPAQLTFNASNWNVPQSIVASASKDSNVIGSIPSQILHTIVSNDSQYAALGNFTIGASLLVTSDTTPPPSLQLAQFGNTGADIIVTFASAVDLSSVPTPASVACSSVFSFTTGFYGTAPLCGWTSTTTIRILLGKSPMVMPGDKCSVLAGLKATPTSTLSMPASFVAIQTPVTPPVPIVSVTGPQNLGSCDDLYLDGRSSSGSGGRGMQWVWNVTNAPTLAPVLAALGTTAQTLSIPSASLVPGATYFFSLTCTNFFGATSSSGLMAITKGSMPLPLVTINGPSIVQLLRSSALSLSSTASPATCGSTDVSTIGLTFQWYVGPSGGAAQVVTSLSRNPRQLQLPARTYGYGTYTVTVFVAVTGQPMQNNTASVTVQVVPSNLVAIITGGSRTVGNQNDLVLNGSTSYDPDMPTTALLHMWQCADAATGAVSCAGVAIANGSTSIVAKANLPPSTTISIQLTVLDPATGRQATAATTFRVVLGSPPTTAIAPMSQAKYNPTAKIFMAGSVSSSIDSAPTVIWSIQGDTSQAIANAAFGLPRSSMTMVLMPNTLTPGQTYVLVLTGYDKFGQSSNASVSVVINEPPTSGTVVSVPTSGTTLQTMFAISSLNWVDVDLPLTYSFKYIVGTSQASSTEVALGDYALSTTFSTLLPIGGGADSTITIVAYIADAYGYATKVYVPIVVAAPTGSASSQQALLQNQSSQLVATAASSDPGSVVNMVAMLASMLTSTTTTAATTGGGSSASATPATTAASAGTPAPASLKACPTSSASLVCSGHGTCTLSPASCTADNLECTATCTCDPSWYNMDCDTSQAAYDKKQQMLGNLLTAMVSASGNIEPTPEAVEQQTAAVQSITANAGFLSPTQQTQALDLVANVLAGSASVQLSPAATTAVGGSLSNLLDAGTTTSTSSSRRRLDSEAAAAKTEKVTSTVSLLASAMLNGYVPGEAAVQLNTKNVKLTLQRHDPSTIGGTIALPLSASQVAQNYASPTFSLPSDMPISSACSQAVDTHATFYSTNLYQFANASQSINSGVMGLKLLCDYSSNPFPVANLTNNIVIRLRKLAQYSMPGAPMNGSISCVAGQAFSVNVTCDASQNLYKHVACNGSANYTLQYTCPQLIPTPQCQYWDTATSSWSTDGCRLVPDPDDNYVLCECNHLTDFSSQVNLAYKAVADNFIAVIDHHTTLEDVKENLNVVIIMAAFIVLYGISLVVCLRLDKRDRLRHLQRQKAGVQEKERIKLRDLFELPRVVAAKTRREKLVAVLSGFWEGLKEEHNILSMILKYNATFTRPQRCMIIFTVIMSQMFINALLYRLRQMTPNIGTILVSGIVSSVCMMPVTLAFVILFRKAGKMHDYTVRYEIEDDEHVVEVEVDAYGAPVQYSKYDMMCMDLQGLLNGIAPDAYGLVLQRLRREANLTSFASTVAQTLFLILNNREVRDPEPLDEVDLVPKSAPRFASKRRVYFRAPKIASASRAFDEPPPTDEPMLISVELAVAKLQGLWAHVYDDLNQFQPTAISSASRSKLSYMLKQAMGLQKEESSGTVNAIEAQELAACDAVLNWCRQCYECAECFAQDTNAVLRHARHEMERTKEQLIMTKKIVQKQLRERLSSIVLSPPTAVTAKTSGGSFNRKSLMDVKKVVLRNVNSQVQLVVKKTRSHMLETQQRLKAARRQSMIAQKAARKEAKQQLNLVLHNLHGLKRWKKRWEVYEEAKEKHLLESMPLHERQRYLREQEKLKNLKFTARTLYNLFLRKKPQRLEKPIFPEFVTYVLYVMCTGIDAFAAYFILQFSFAVGHDTATMWIGSLFTGLSITYLVSDPLHIFMRVGVLPVLASVFLVNTGLFEALGAEVVAVGSAAAVGIAGVANLREKRTKPDGLTVVAFGDAIVTPAVNQELPRVAAPVAPPPMAVTPATAIAVESPAEKVGPPAVAVPAKAPLVADISGSSPSAADLTLSVALSGPVISTDTNAAVSESPSTGVAPAAAPSASSTKSVTRTPAPPAATGTQETPTVAPVANLETPTAPSTAAVNSAEVDAPAPVDEGPPTFTCVCGATMASEARVQHTEQSCSHRMVQCRAGCGVYLQARARGSHEMSQCRLLMCSCDKMVLRHKMLKHLEDECPRRIVACRLGCGANMAMNAREKHERSACDYRITSCADCNTVLPIRDLPAHKAACSTKATVRGPAMQLVKTAVDVVDPPVRYMAGGPPSPTATRLQGPPLLSSVATAAASAAPTAAATVAATATTAVAAIAPRVARGPPIVTAGPVARPLRGRAPPLSHAPGVLQGPPRFLAPGAQPEGDAKAKDDLVRKSVAMAVAAEQPSTLVASASDAPSRAFAPSLTDEEVLAREAAVEQSGAGQLSKAAFEGAEAALFAEPPAEASASPPEEPPKEEALRPHPLRGPCTANPFTISQDKA
ncbi:transmembrane protein [Achlya hypogyna]|uniref:Transmembrane protein n=1 Tax=Achlya hypogyna TaxID=1202772 RepID=A0A1V9Z3X1_ACHHY|nr:transmembrane protein [Achlya hypogyna]